MDVLNTRINAARRPPLCLLSVVGRQLQFNATDHGQLATDKSDMVQIEINNQQSRLSIDCERLSRVAETVLATEGIEEATINIAVVDDPTIHDLNRRFLNHDEPTDVLSFPFDDDAGRLEGDVIVSADTAVRMAAQLQWAASDELLLYVVHGVLHLVGYDDLDPNSRAEMHERQRDYLLRLGVRPPADFEGDVAERSTDAKPEPLLAQKS
jgi:probable rRNA maturation factor